MLMKSACPAKLNSCLEHLVIERAGEVREHGPGEQHTHQPLCRVVGPGRVTTLVERAEGAPQPGEDHLTDEVTRLALRALHLLLAPPEVASSRQQPLEFRCRGLAIGCQHVDKMAHSLFEIGDECLVPPLYLPVSFTSAIVD